LPGPYAPSILRFQISFPPAYPSLPPLITFSTDMFHPLITPLTTYMYTTDIQDSGTVSATDDERLPPGGFSLRHGFPAWFGRASRRSADRERVRSSALQTPAKTGIDTPDSESNSSPTPGRTLDSTGSREAQKEQITTYDILRYVRSTFDEEEVLDSVPLEAAGNPGAWHAWRTHQVKLGKVAPIAEQKGRKTLGSEISDDEGSTGSGSVAEGYQSLAGGTSSSMTSRRPGEWNWDGVWEVRVKKGVEASLSEAALYGKDAGDDLIRFLNMEGPEYETMMENIRRSVEAVEPQRRGIV
jgi:hypothetical protein